ncbi:hypothetical protein CEXT_563221 [Caerostris extrusa]|uniref:Uncharacterized protein n=1 Tax=Caerostris extrusa TaxID=172846 RepID=A0AAV4WWJ4_CAEEX|nr:hypothetical protein CEXT_563221 [Caerostris extrusa]
MAPTDLYRFFFVYSGFRIVLKKPKKTYRRRRLWENSFLGDCSAVIVPFAWWEFVHPPPGGVCSSSSPPPGSLTAHTRSLYIPSYSLKSFFASEISGYKVKRQQILHKNYYI